MFNVIVWTLFFLFCQTLTRMYELHHGCSQQQQQQQQHEQQQRTLGSAKEVMLQDFRAYNNHKRLDWSPDDPSKPTLIISAGLPNMPIDLQCLLCDPETSELLLQDNWVFLGTCPFEACSLEYNDLYLEDVSNAIFRHPQYGYDGAIGPIRHVLNDAIRNRTPHLEDTFMSALEDARLNRRNCLIINQDMAFLAAGNIRALASFITLNWNAHILVSAPSLADYWPLRYATVQDPYTNRPARFWPGLYDPEKMIVGEDIAPFDFPTIDGNEDWNEYTLGLQEHPAKIVQANFGLYFKHSHRLMGSLTLEDWACKTLPIPQLCAHVMSRPKRATAREIPVYDIDRDRLAVAAVRAGLLNVTSATEPKRVRVVDAMKKVDYPLHLTCWSRAKLQQYVNWTLSLGDISKKSKRICSVDTAKTLQEPKWIQFFQLYQVGIFNETEVQTDDDGEAEEEEEEEEEDKQRVAKGESDEQKDAVSEDESAEDIVEGDLSSAEEEVLSVNLKSQKGNDLVLGGQKLAQKTGGAEHVARDVVTVIKRQQQRDGESSSRENVLELKDDALDVLKNANRGDDDSGSAEGNEKDVLLHRGEKRVQKR